MRDVLINAKDNKIEIIEQIKKRIKFVIQRIYINILIVCKSTYGKCWFKWIR